jgi:hypothetical protein
MRARVNRALVAELLEDPTLSYREISRRANCSDFSVRAIARGLASDDSYDRDAATIGAEPLTLRDWGVGIGILSAIFGGIWLLARWLPPPDGAM